MTIKKYDRGYYTSYPWSEDDHSERYENILKKRCDEENKGIFSKREPSKSKTFNSGNETMSKLVNTNKAAAIHSAKLEVGRSAIKIVATKVGDQLPMMLRGYKDHPLFEVAVANLVAAGLDQFMSGNKKAEQISQCMIQASMDDLVRSFDVSNMLRDLVDNVNIASVTDLEQSSTEG